MARLEQSPIACENFPRRVLVVDDEPLIRWAASSTLAEAGFSVTEAGSIEHARELTSSAAFDLALMDVRLPDGDGLAFMHEIQRDQPACRFIMMTAFRTPELTAQASEQAVRVLDKPFGMPELASLAVKMVGGQEPDGARDRSGC